VRSSALVHKCGTKHICNICDNMTDEKWEKLIFMVEEKFGILKREKKEIEETPLKIAPESKLSKLSSKIETGIRWNKKSKVQMPNVKSMSND